MHLLIAKKDTKASIRGSPELSSLPFLPLSSECDEAINTYTAAGIFIYTSLVCQRSKCQAR